MKAVLTLYRLIPGSLKARFLGVTLMAVVVALMEMMGIASIMPFVALLSDPSAFERALAASPVAFLLPEKVQLPSVHVVGFVVIGLFVLTNLLGLASLWMSIRFSAALGVRLCQDLAASYLRRGHQFIRAEGVGVLANDVTRETEKLAVGGALQLCLLVSKSIQVAMIVGLLAIVSPMFVLVFFFGASGLYLSLYLLLRSRVSRAGQESALSVADSSRRAHELFAASKEIIVRGQSDYFVKRVGAASNRYFRADAVARLAPVVPKYLIELVAFSALLAVPIYRSLNGQEYQSVVPLITLFAYAGYRILPAVQQLYSSFSILKFYDPLAQKVSSALRVPVSSTEHCEGSAEIRNIDGAIRFSGIECTYPGQDVPALKDLDLLVESGDKLAIIGASGSGKSTLLDVLLGLMPVRAGAIHVGSTSTGLAPIPWAVGTVGYVPQASVIIAATVAENIAFGEAHDRIDLDRCQAAARLACIDDVIDRLPMGYATVVGEGLALSGGESQRIAIARALYCGASLLIMDEPSSALDPMVSTRLIRNLCGLGAAQTLVVVTHDWDLLPCFSKIAVVDGGRIVAVGRPDEMGSIIAELRTRLSAQTGKDL